MQRRNTNISLLGSNSRALSTGTALDETTSPQEDAQSQKHMPVKYGKGQGLEIEQLVHPAERQKYLRACNDATDADGHLAQGLVEVKEDGNSKLLSKAEYIAHATQSGNFKNNTRIAKFIQMDSLLESSGQKTRSQAHVTSLETEAKELSIKTEHVAARERNEVALAKFNGEQDEYDSKLDAARAILAGSASAAPVTAPAVRRGKQSAREAAIAADRARAQGSAVAPAAEPAGAPA
jgi:DNA-directed RNA polymerase beta subunit